MQDIRNHHEKRKMARNAGLSYTSTGGKLVEAKKVGPECKCKYKCYQRIPQKTRETLFQAFYSLKEYSEQNGYLFGLIKASESKKSSNDSVDPPNLKPSQKIKYNYCVRVQGKEISVCRLAFANIHAISLKRIRILCKKLESGEIFPRDLRGKHENRPVKLDPKWKRLIREHLAKIIQDDDLIYQYLKKDKNGQVVNLSKMHKDFVKKHEKEIVSSKTDSNPAPKVKRWLYNQTFHQMLKEKEFYSARKRLEQLNQPDLQDAKPVNLESKKAKPQAQFLFANVPLRLQILTPTGVQVQNVPVPVHFSVRNGEVVVLNSPSVTVTTQSVLASETTAL